MNRMTLLKACAAVVMLGGGLLLKVSPQLAQVVDPPAPLASLKTVPVPGPAPEVLAEFVQDKNAAIQLGKALFWDMQVGSDGIQSCASCHFNAGADNRSKNQLSPGLLADDRTFQVGGPNYTLTRNDFPFTRHANLDDLASRTSDSNDVTSSQGVSRANFVDIDSYSATDKCEQVSDAVADGGDGFNVAGVNVRRVEPRNTPTVINAVFNFRNFWDGRAVNDFNGIDPFGQRNANALVWKLVNGVLAQVPIAINISSLASQASGPPLSAFEMSCANRPFAKLGKKMLNLKPLAKQKVHANDSVLGSIASQYSNGLRMSYKDLIAKAFRSEYWNSSTPITLTNAGAQAGSMDKQWYRYRSSYGQGSDEFTQMEANFALFFSLAVQLYESTLVSDDTQLDRFLEGDTLALTAQQQRGMSVFEGQGRCINCHAGAELTNASVRNVLNQRLERMTMGDGGEAIYDNGFYNIGVRPTTDDLGVGGLDAFGNPLSETRMAQIGKTRLLGNEFDPNKEPAVGVGQRVAVDGAFKTPGLRNVELTGPFFHNGGKLTLMQVVDFYNRGGDFSNENRANLDADIAPLGLTQAQKEDLVAFLLALTDARVRWQKAPFDHPAICIPNGHPGDSTRVERDWRTGAAKDSLRCLPAVGAGGATEALKAFLSLDQFQR